jgi:hypothetical protein
MECFLGEIYGNNKKNCSVSGVMGIDKQGKGRRDKSLFSIRVRCLTQDWD